MLLRNGSLPDIARFALHHPKMLVRFPLQLNSLLDLHDIELALHSDRGRMTEQAQGHMDYTDPIGPLPEHCEIPADYLRPPDKAAIEALVRKYETAQTHVLLYMAPVPACANAVVVQKETAAELPAAPPGTLPPGWFAADGMCAHVLPPHVAVSTQLLIDAVRSHSASQEPERGSGTLAVVASSRGGS
jgi:hypothetical protein